MKNSNIKISKSSVLNLINDYISLRINRLDAFPSIDMINHAAYQLLQLCKIQGIKYVNEITLHGTCAKNHILFDVFSKEKCINYLAGINVDTKTILPNTVFVSFSMSVDSIIKQILEEYKNACDDAAVFVEDMVYITVVKPTKNSLLEVITPKVCQHITSSMCTILMDSNDDNSQDESEYLTEYILRFLVKQKFIKPNPEF